MPSRAILPEYLSLSSSLCASLTTGRHNKTTHTAPGANYAAAVNLSGCLTVLDCLVCLDLCCLPFGFGLSIDLSRTKGKRNKTFEDFIRSTEREIIPWPKQYEVVCYLLLIMGIMVLQGYKKNPI